MDWNFTRHTLSPLLNMSDTFRSVSRSCSIFAPDMLPDTSASRTKSVGVVNGLASSSSAKVTCGFRWRRCFVSNLHLSSSFVYQALKAEREGQSKGGGGRALTMEVTSEVFAAGMDT